MALVQDGGIPIPESDEDLQNFLEYPEWIHYVGMFVPPRPGVHECIALLEHQHYQPGTERNDLFIMRIIEFSQMLWVMISIPISEKHLMEEVSDECGLRIADGVPTSISLEGVEAFPASNERVFTLENKPDHPVYQNDPELTKKVLEAEKETLDRVHRAKQAH